MRVLLLLICCITLSSMDIVGQIYVEGGYTASTCFGYQKDDTQPQWNPDGSTTFVPTHQGDDYVYGKYTIGIGYRWKEGNREHFIGVDYNRKGGGGLFSVDIFRDEFAKEVLGNILINHIREGGYTVDSTHYMFGVFNDNIGLNYGLYVYDVKGFRFKPFVQADISFRRRHRVISVYNRPVATLTDGGSRGEELLRTQRMDYLLNLGIEIEKNLTDQIALYASVQQAITSTTKVGILFSNKTYITAFELGMRFYRPHK